MFLVANSNESESCDELYFNKQVLFWQDYKISNLRNVQCDYSRPNYLANNNWYQYTEKLARNYLFFSDSLSHSDPSKGVLLTQQVSGSFASPEPFLASSLQPNVRFPWTSTSGFTVPLNLFFKLGNPDRSAVIWGIRFLKTQLAGQYPIQIRLRYSYYKDVDRGSYPFFWFGQNPNELEQTAFVVDVNEQDIDSYGIYYFKDKNDPSKPMIFVASTVMVYINNIAPKNLNFDLVGSFFDFETAVDGKHGDNKTDNFLNKNIGQFWVKEDGSETTITTSVTSDVPDLCESSCSSPSVVYTGARRLSDTEFKCLCFDQRFDAMVAKSKYYNALYHYDCSKITPSDEAKFSAEPLLAEFLTSRLDLLTTRARDNDTQQRANLCNPGRVVNLATLYLSVSLELPLSSWVPSWHYDPSQSYLFPGHPQTGPGSIFPPSQLAGFPGLEQVYWTILAQYSPDTEPGLRTGRSNMFCRVKGRAVYQHCINRSQGVCASHNCLQVWRYFLEACHRVRSLNTNQWPYYLHPSHTPASYCLSDWTRQQGHAPLRLYSINRAWDRTCPELEDQITALADTSLAQGWLGLEAADTGSFSAHRIPGTAFKYRCSTGFEVSTDSNPEQVLVCHGSRRVDFSQVQSCSRKFSDFLVRRNNDYNYLAAIRCSDSPDLSSMGSSYSWTGSDVFSTNITYSCPPGQAFQGGSHQTQLVSTCEYQSSGDSSPTWKYNDNNNLPDCEGKFTNI